MVFGAAAVSLFVDGDAGAGGFGTFVALVCVLCAVLLFRSGGTRRPARARAPRRAGDGFYYGDATPTQGWAGVPDGRTWGGDGGADAGPSGSGPTGHHGHHQPGPAPYDGGSGGFDGAADSGSGGSGGSDGGS